MPSKKKISPTRVVRNAFFAAAAADGFWYQNPINKYEVSPTSSQNTKSCMIELLMTMPSIEKLNSDR